jgi:hypothetical protein
MTIRLPSYACSRAVRSLTMSPRTVTGTLTPRPLIHNLPLLHWHCRAFATQERRQALLAAGGLSIPRSKPQFPNNPAAAAFDGELGAIMRAFTQQVASTPAAANRNPVTIMQHARECSAAEITEMERMMRLTADELSVRGPSLAARVCVTFRRF